MRMTLGMALLAAAATAARAAPALDETAAAQRILDHVKVLSSDEFGGRGPGTAGEEKTVAYLAGEFRALGLAPGNPDGTYLQDVPMMGIFSVPAARFVVGGQPIAAAVLNDFVAVSHRTVPDIEVKDSGLVFVGYGVQAPEYGWDDFKGVDVKGKTVVMLINDPPVPDPHDPTKLDPKMFKGRAMTYYGRWTYKYEEAAAQGAAACLIIHETGPAGYPFSVVAGSWGRENFSLVDPDGGAGRCAVEAWITLAFAKTLISAAGYDFDALKAAAVRKDFRPVDLKGTASFSVQNKMRSLNSRNVIAKLPGSDPALAGEYVIVSAHWDHLGINPKLKGDQIFHGAADNATGVAGILEIAREFTQLPPAERPKRTLLFMAVTAEEQGLLGSEYYARHPLYPLEKTLADLNLDVMQTAGPAHDMEVVGVGASTLDDVAASVLTAEGRILVPESDPEKGHFYRSDQFEFAKVGIPSFYPNMDSGIQIIGKPAGYGLMRRVEYVDQDYHKVTDQIKPWWDLRGAAIDADVMFHMGLQIADAPAWPAWKDGSEFKARREAMLSAAAH